MPQFKVQIDGKETEIEIADEAVIAAGFLPSSKVEKEYVPKTNVERTIQARVEAEKTATEARLKEDPAFLESILQESGIPVKDGKPVLPKGGLSAEEVQSQLRDAQARWEQQTDKKVVQPLKEQLEAAAKTNGALKDRILISDLIQHGVAEDVKDEFLFVAPGSPASAAGIVSQFRHRFDWADDAKQWALVTGRNADGSPVFEVSSDPSRQYAGVPELYASIRQDKTLATKIFKDGRPGSTGVGDTRSNGQGGKQMSRSRFESMSPTEQRDFVLKDGGTVVEG